MENGERWGLLERRGRAKPVQGSYRSPPSNGSLAHSWIC
jgi:hypothetical protein